MAQVVYAIIFDQVFFHVTPSLLSVFGSLIIVLSAVYVAVRMRGSLHCDLGSERLSLAHQGRGT